MKKILLSLIILCPLAGFSQNLLTETFPHSAGDLVGKGNWVITGTTITNPIQLTTPNTLIFPNYQAGVGMVSLLTTGQDANIPLSAGVNTGSLFTSFLINVSSAQTAGDYFFNFGATGNTSTFYSRCFIKSVGAGFNLGIGKTSGTGTTITYGTTEYSFNTTYLIVLKYQFNSVTAVDDVCSIFVNPDLSTGSENGLIASEVTGSDATISFSSMNLRQGSSTNAAQLKLTSINSGTSWANLVLPISLTTFTGKAVDKNILLKWNTASEINNNYFEVKHSSDGKAFTAIGKVNGAGNSSTAKDYSFADENPAAGTNYYQLVQHDFDGKTSSSAVVAVDSKIDAAQLTVYASSSEVKISISSPNQSKGFIQLFDLSGRKLAEQAITVNKGFNNISLPVSLPAGIHFARYTAEGVVVNHKFVR
jgi:hypothetical protein